MQPGRVSAQAHRLARRALRRSGRVQPGPVLPATVLELARAGPARLVSATPRDRALHIATIIPSFRRGSGGHGTVVNLAKALVARGHSVSLWLEDFELLHAREPDAAIRQTFASFFDAEELELSTDFTRWRGADVVLATGWQTVPRALLLPGASARAYLVQDHEPEFYGASAQALFAAATYRHGLHCIAASPWLADLLRSRYGASASHFDLAVDHSTYQPAPEPRREDLVLFYARSATPRRAVPLGLLALEELTQRRPGIEVVLFGGDSSAWAPFPHSELGLLEPAALARLYRRGTVGMVFSLTNPSLISLEMMACGLPCVELATEPMLASFQSDGPLTLAEPAPLQICSTIEALLDDGAHRSQLGRGGRTFMAGRTWDRAAEQLEGGLQTALELSR